MSSLSALTEGLQITCQPNYTPPFRLFARNNSLQYQVQAFPTCRRKSTVVHISTKCPALVTYVLGTQWAQQLDGDQYLHYSGVSPTWSEADEEDIAMRILRVGGAVLDTSYFSDDEYYAERDEQFAAFSRTKQSIFGWPEHGGLWVLQLNGLVLQEFWKAPDFQCWAEDGITPTAEAIRDLEDEDEDDFDWEGNPLGEHTTFPHGTFDTSNLNEAKSMREYCTQLERSGGVFYDNPQMSQEAVNAGIFDKATLTKPWTGSVEWMATRGQWDAQTSQPATNDRLLPSAASSKSRCVVS
jgi:hypothetical protein